MAGSRDQAERAAWLARFDEITDALALECHYRVVNDGYRLIFAQQERIRELEERLARTAPQGTAARNQELKDQLRALRAVRAGWAFGVPDKDSREQWLDEVAAAVAPGPVFAELDQQGQLADYTGFGLWMVAVWLPEGREADAVAALASHGLVVYRMWRPGGDR